MADRQPDSEAEKRESTAIQYANLYFIPVGILAAALAEASTEELKTALSIAGMVCSWFWAASVCEIIKVEPTTRREWLLKALPIVVTMGWTLSVAVHGWPLLKVLFRPLMRS